MSRTGNSCHLCHTSCAENVGLFFCSAIKPNGRACRKKLCDRCLSRHFPDLYDPELQTAGKWTCPSCLLRCPCVNCRVCEHGAVRKRCAVLVCIHHPSCEGKEFTRRRRTKRVSPYNRIPADKESDSTLKSSENKCPSCDGPNRPTSKFCGECGFSLHVKCLEQQTFSNEEHEESSIGKLAAAALSSVVEPVKRSPRTLPSPRKDEHRTKRSMSVGYSSSEHVDSEKMQDEETPELGQSARRLPSAQTHVLFQSPTLANAHVLSQSPTLATAHVLSSAFRHRDVNHALHALEALTLSPVASPVLAHNVINLSTHPQSSVSYSYSPAGSTVSTPLLAQSRRLVALSTFTPNARSPALQGRRDSAPNILTASPAAFNLAPRRIAQRSQSSPASNPPRELQNQQVSSSSVSTEPSSPSASFRIVPSPFLVVRPIPRRIEEGQGIHLIPKDNKAE
eukprot:g25926.t1